jgi:arsenate reductase
MNQTLESIINNFSDSDIKDERKLVLDQLTKYVSEKVSKNGVANLNFICTHNSRRSQLSQVWAQTAAAHYHINVNCYSGGVEVTACNERAIASLVRMGFDVKQKGEDNPSYFVRHEKGAIPSVLFSKTYDNAVNPKNNFAAIMTCDHADENCPFIPGCDVRLPIRYEDPKAFDDTPLEAEKYDERSLQIANEMFYAFKNINI